MSRGKGFMESVNCVSREGKGLFIEELLRSGISHLIGFPENSHCSCGAKGPGYPERYRVIHEKGCQGKPLELGP